MQSWIRIGLSLALLGGAAAAQDELEEVVRRYADGSLRERGSTLDGQRTGNWTEWYPGGQKSSEGTYVRARRHGPWATWHEDGAPASAGKYAAGEREGAWSFWRPDGSLDPRRSGTYTAGLTQRDRYRRDIQDELGRVPGWRLHETDHFFLITRLEEGAFLEETKSRAEGMLAVFREDFPVPAGREPRPDPFWGVVRMMKDRAQYHSYGGPGGSVGYWSAGARELVLFDDRAGEGRDTTWAVLQGAGFQQWFDYAHPGLEAHPWFRQGHIDHYSGYRRRGERFAVQPFAWRANTAQELLRTGTHVPLGEFIRQDRAALSSGRHGHRAQAWSLVHFLRGLDAAEGDRARWAEILPTYLRVLVETGDSGLALESAFEGVDLEALEAAWIRAMR